MAGSIDPTFPYMHTHAHTQTHTHKHRHEHLRTHVHTQTQSHTDARTETHADTHQARTQTNTHTRTCRETNTCTYACTHTGSCTHTNTHTHTRAEPAVLGSRPRSQRQVTSRPRSDYPVIRGRPAARRRPAAGCVGVARARLRGRQERRYDVSTIFLFYYLMSGK